VQWVVTTSLLFLSGAVLYAVATVNFTSPLTPYSPLWGLMTLFVVCEHKNIVGLLHCLLSYIIAEPLQSFFANIHQVS